MARLNGQGMELVRAISRQCETPSDVSKLLKELFAGTLEQMLEAEINVPRDRNGAFEPRVIPKRQTRTDEIETRIMAMYGKGMSTREIEEYVKDIYGGRHW